MLENLIPLVAKNFSICMLVAAVGLALANAIWRRGTIEGSLTEQLFRWVSLLGAGAVGLFTFACHVFAPEQTAANIGWATSPFQYEVGMADLAIGVLGVVAFWSGLGFRLATTIATICWLGGDAIGHVRQIAIANNYAPGNAGPWLWTDILVPLVMLVTIMILWRRHAKETVEGKGILRLNRAEQADLSQSVVGL